MFQKLGFKKFVSISLGVLTLMLGVFFVAPSFEQKAFAVEAVIDDGDLVQLYISLSGDGGPPVCSYPAPMMGCNYEPGPGYNPMTNCGMVLSCASYTVTFTGSTGGIVSGDLSQNFSMMGEWMEGGPITTPVHAIPNSGYAFYGWNNGSFMNPLVVSNVSSNMSFVASFIQAQLYTDPNGVYSFYYPFGLQYKNPASAGTINVVFTKYGNTYSSLAPVITVAKGPSDRSLSQVVVGVSAAYRKLFRNNYTVTTEIERTAHGVPTKQLHITGKIAGVDKTFIITFIRLLSKVYVVSANGTLANASTLDSIVDTMISTRKFSPIPAGVDGNPTCMFCE